MATLAINTSLNMADGFGVSPDFGNPNNFNSVQTPTEFIAHIADGTIYTFTGTGFTFDADQNALTGTFTGISESSGGSVNYTLTNASLPVSVANSLEGNAQSLDSVLLQGNDSITASGKGDTILGYAGADTISLGSGNNMANGNQGADSIILGSGNNTVLGGQDNDTIIAGAGNNQMNGNLGADSVSGGTGNNILHGGQGADTIAAGSGADTIYGDLGNDLLVSGHSAGTEFVFAAGSGVDTISGFKSTDQISIASHVNGSDITSFSSLASHITSVGANTVIDLGAGNSITLNGVNSTSLTSSEFIFS